MDMSATAWALFIHFGMKRLIEVFRLFELLPETLSGLGIHGRQPAALATNPTVHAIDQGFTFRKKVNGANARIIANVKLTAANPLADTKIVKMLSKHRHQTHVRFGLAIEQGKHLVEIR